MKARTIQLGSYRMDITVESNHYEKNGDAWEGTVDQSAAWYSVEYKLYIDGKILRGTTYFGKDALKLQRGVPAGACGLVRLEGNGKSVPLYLTAENAELVEKTVRDLEAEASDPETDRIIKEKAEEALAAQRGHYKRIKDFGEKEIACNGHLMTRAEVKAFHKSWNKIENEGAEFLTSIEGEEIGIFSYDCGPEVVKTLSGRFGIYNMHADHGIVIFEKWNR